MHYIPVDMNLECSKRLAVEQVVPAEQVEHAAEWENLVDYRQVELAAETMEPAEEQVESIAELVKPRTKGQ